MPRCSRGGDNTGAGSEVDPTCDVTTVGFEDVWYAFNSGNYSSVTIDVAVGTMTDLVVEVFEGGCAGTSVTCTIGALSNVVPTTPGTDYVILISSNLEFGLGGTFDICLSGTGGGSGPANDECANATPITPGATCVPTQSNMIGATQSLAPATCSTFTSSTANDVWYSFVADGPSATVAVGGFGDDVTGLDPIVEIFSGACGSLSSLGCMDSSLRAGVEALTVPTTAGSTYYYRLYYWNYGTAQTELGFGTCVVGAAGPGPANDLCDDATQIGVNPTCVATQGNLEGATQSLAPATCSNFTAGAANDVWYTFTAVGTSTTVEVTGGGDATTGLDPVLEVFSGDCAGLTSLGCVDATVRGGTETMVMATTAGTTYLYRVYYWPYPTAQTVFDYTTCVYGSGGGSTPPNDACDGAVVAALATPGTITLSGDNTGATVDAPTNFVIVWEAFTITECSNVDIGYCVPGSEFDDFLVNLSIGCPDFLTGVLTGTTSVDQCTLSFVELPAGTYYVPVLVDPLLTPVGAYSITVTTTACAPVGPYCEAGADGEPPGDLDLEERIINVTFSNIDNDSPDAIPVAPAYQDFTNVVGEVVGGQTYPIAIDVAREGANTSWSENQVIVWIDFNQDQDFEDVGELVHTSAVGSVDIYTGDIAIPATASLGTTRMRIRLHDVHDGSSYPNNFNDTPCGLSSFGEVEDYTIDVIGIITGVSEANVATLERVPQPQQW